MKSQFFFPAPVEVVKVTNENLADVAEWCGGKVASTESRRVPGRQDSYVWVPTPKGNSISWAFPGMYITKRLVVTVKDEMKETFAVFRRDYFSRNYFDTPTEATDKTWEKQASIKEKEKIMTGQTPIPKPSKPRPSYKSKAEIEQEKEIASEVPADETPIQKFRHQHSSTEGCDTWSCITDRYTDGIHIFTDIRINTIATTTPKENDMELNENAVPEATPEEAAKLEEDNANGVELPANPQEAAYVPVEPGANPADMPIETVPEEVVDTEPDSTELVTSDIETGEEVATDTPILTEEPAFQAAGSAEESNVVTHGSDGFNAGTLD